MRGKPFFVRVRHKTIRLSVSFFAFVLVSTVFGLSPGVSAQPTDLWLEESPYTHQNDLFVVGEELTIHIEGPVDDIYDIMIVYDPYGAYLLKREWNDRTVPSEGEIVLTYQTPMSASSNEAYQVQVWDETRIIMYLTYDYWLVLFQADVEVARPAYLPGETVDVNYICWYVQDYGPVSSGNIDWKVLDPMSAEIALGQRTISSTQDAMGTFSFDLGLGSPLGWYDVMMWLNDTDAGMPDHVVFTMDTFRVDGLSVSVTVDAPIYAPGESVRVDIRTEIGPFAAPGAEVDVVVRENGVVAPQYGINNLITPMDGWVTHLFILDPATPDSADFEVEATATLLGNTVSSNDTFVVQNISFAVFDVTLITDRAIYLSGDTITATALTQASGTTTDANYIFSVHTVGGISPSMSIQNTSVLQYQVPDDLEGLVGIDVIAKNSEGYEAWDTTSVDVMYGLLLVNVDREEYEAGDDITVSFELASNVMTNPTFYYVVTTLGLPVESGLAGTDNFTFRVPLNPVDRYNFIVIAVDRGYVAKGYGTASMISGYLLSVDFDKEAYMPGETMVITYELEARGFSTLPGVYSFAFGLMTLQPHYAQTFASNGTLTYTIPLEADDGYHLFATIEMNVYAYSYQMVRIGNVTVPPEQNITRLQLQLDNLQANMTSLQTTLWDVWNQLNASNAEAGDLKAILWDVWDELNTTATLVNDLENRIAELEAEVAGLEEELAAAESPPADNTFAYVALLFGIAGLVMGIVAVMRKPPRSRLPEQQPAVEGPTEEMGEPETY